MHVPATVCCGDSYPRGYCLASHQVYVKEREVAGCPKSMLGSSLTLLFH
jgi:hypothetical protein